MEEKIIMKKLMTCVVAVLMTVTLFAFAACGPRKSPVAEDGSKIVTFWGWGDPEEVKVFKKLVNDFNATHKGKIKVAYEQKPGDSYSSATIQALQGRTSPDVVYVGDGDLKQWVSLNVLTPLDDYLDVSEEIDPDDIWPSALQRYRYDVETQQSRPTDPIYAVPKDIGPTVIYYNENAFKEVGIEIISIDADKIEAYNRANGKNYLKKGYYELDNGQLVDPESSAHGAVKVFNNRIAMTWEENVKLSKLLTKSYNKASPTDYGYFTEWWFSYGWSVYGDCIKFDEASGKWKFSLGDETVLKNENGEDMPTMREAFTHFVSLSQPKTTDVDGNGTMGLAITPTPDTLSTIGKSGYFTSGKVAMMVDGRWATVTYRENIKNFTWNVAPLPKAEKGVEAGHSGSVGMGIWAKSKVKDEAWKFCEYIAGATGQSAQAATGFNIPNQKSIANTEVFLQSDKLPKNASIFLKAAEVQRAGDWAYLPDGLWIEEWAPVLNGDVRNGKKNLTQFFADVTNATNISLAKYTS